MSQPASVEEFRVAVQDALRRDSRCCYCGRDLKAVKTLTGEPRVMLIDRKPQRVACISCPEAIEVAIQ